MTRKPVFWLMTLTMCIQASAFAQSSGFNYQGKLADGGNAANGQYDFQFQLFDALSGGTQQGTMVVVSNVSVTAGIFTGSLTSAPAQPASMARRVSWDARGYLNASLFTTYGIFAGSPP